MGLFDSPDPAAWYQLGVMLGLTPYRPIAPYGRGANFRHLKRSLGMPVTWRTEFSHRLYGARRGVEVMVVQYDTGSGSSTTTWTGAVARVDPPLFLGLVIEPHSFFDRIFGANDIQVGHPAADDKLDITSFDPARTAMLLSMADQASQNVLSHLAGLASKFDLYVGDSVVAIAQTEVQTDAGTVLEMLDPAIDLAAWLAARRKLVPATHGELQQQQAWQAFADARGLKLDASRMVVVGTRDGTKLEIALETEAQTICTTLSARFPHTIPVAFSVRRTFTPPFLQGLFSQDIEVGDKEFDDLYKVKGHPEDVIRQGLARPGLLAVLKHLGAFAQELEMNHTGLYVRVPGPSPSAAHIDALASLACSTSKELFAEIERGPYR